MSLKAKERRLKRIIQHMRAIEFNSQYVKASYYSGQPDRVEIRHPVRLPDGTFRIVGVIEMEPRPVLTYARDQYREAIELQLAKSLDQEQTW
jgi:hypothetical protein